MNLSAQDPKFVAKQIKNIIYTILSRLKTESQHKSLINVKQKVNDLQVLDLANKKSPGGAAIGTSITIVKNILNGRDPFFIRRVLDELNKEL